MRQSAWRRGEYKEGRPVPADGSSLEATSMQRDTSGCRDDYAYALLMGCIPGATGTIAAQHLILTLENYKVAFNSSKRPAFPAQSSTRIDKVKGSFSILVNGQFIQHISGHNRFKFGVHKYTVIF